MSNLSEELLDGIGTGDRVDVTYGNSTNQKRVTGLIKKLTENILVIEMQNGKTARIMLDDIRAVEIIDDNGEASDPDRASHAVASINEAPEAKAFEQIKAWRPDNFDDKITYQFVFSDWIARLKEIVKSSDNNSVKNALSSAIDSLQYSVKTVPWRKSKAF